MAANWKFKLSFAAWYRDETLTIQQKGQRASKELFRLSAKLENKDDLLHYDLAELANEFAQVEEEVEDFDSIMEQLYDLADDARIWVATF